MNSTNKNLVLLLVAAVTVIFVLVIFLLRGNEDSWICENGQWVKHGNPSASQPTEACPQKKMDDQEGSADTTPLSPQTETSQGLIKVPESLIKDSTIRELDLSDNNIESLPSQVEAWKELRIFKINNNKVKSLPAEIRHWSKLTTLEARNNGMTNVPAEIGQLQNLREIDFSDNQITEFPNEILNLKGLEKLNIRNNPVKPEHLQKLREALTNTTILY